MSNGSCAAISSNITISNLTSPPTPTISANGPTTFCNGSSVTLTSSSATGNLWSNGATSQSITVSNAGNYYVTVSNGNCSSTSSNVTVSILSAPATPFVTASGPTSICSGDILILTSSSTSGNTWSNGATSQSITVSTPGLYYVSVSNGACSATSASVNVSVNQNTSSTLNISAIDIYFLNGQSYTASGTYTQVIPNSNGCDSTITINLTMNYTSLGELQSNDFQIFPNPTMDYFIINVPMEFVGRSYTLLDARGRRVIAGTLTTNQEKLEVSKLATGTYHLKIDQVSERYKLIKQ